VRKEDTEGQGIGASAQKTQANHFPDVQHILDVHRGSRCRVWQTNQDKRYEANGIEHLPLTE
jgi:hypothetical protein